MIEVINNFVVLIYLIIKILVLLILKYYCTKQPKCKPICNSALNAKIKKYEISLLQAKVKIWFLALPSTPTFWSKKVSRESMGVKMKFRLGPKYFIFLLYWLLSQNINIENKTLSQLVYLCWKLSLYKMS